MVYDASREKCGIKEYGNALVKWLKALGVNLKICDLRKEKYVDSVISAICALDSDLVHTQHEYGLFKGHWGWSHLFYYLTLKIFRKKDITTLHTVITPKQALINFIKWDLSFKGAKLVDILKGPITSYLSPFIPLVFTDKAIIHTLRGYSLIPWIGKMKAVFLPHFTPKSRKEVLEKWKECKEKKGVPEVIEVVTPGFIRPTKRYDWAIYALVSLKEEGFPKKIRYRIVGSPQDEVGERWLNIIKSFVEEVKEDLDKLGLEISIETKFMSKEKLIETACNADVVLLPYSDPTQEASGILHDSLTCGRHIVVLKIGDVRNYPKAFYPFGLEDPLRGMKEALRRAFERLLKGERCNEDALAYAYYTAIDRIAEKHVKLYESLSRGRS